MNSDFITKIKVHLNMVQIKHHESITNDHCKWEFLKYDFWQFSEQYSEELAKIKRIQSQNLENLKHLGSTKTLKQLKNS